MGLFDTNLNLIGFQYEYHTTNENNTKKKIILKFDTPIYNYIKVKKKNVNNIFYLLFKKCMNIYQMKYMTSY